MEDVDSDGIYDAPYNINGNNTDHLPLVKYVEPYQEETPIQNGDSSEIPIMEKFW